MTLVSEHPSSLLRQWQGDATTAAAEQILGETPISVDLDRVHFPGRRPVQINLMANLPSGRAMPLLAEYCPNDAEGHAAQAFASLKKSRNGQKAGLLSPVIAVVESTGLVLRKPGFDERLPGLRLLYDPIFARSALETAMGQYFGDFSVELVTHRLGKRAVLRITCDQRVIFVRLRTIKSEAGENRLARHRMLWDQLAEDDRLCIPEPLGELSHIGASFFSALSGKAPDFGPKDSSLIARGLNVLQWLAPERLPTHSGSDEARLLEDWLTRCRVWRPDIARRVAPVLSPHLQILAQADYRFVPCHRDLHEKQILIDNGAAGLLDFDTLCWSAPALDAGNLLAHLCLAERDETQLRDALDRPRLGLWRRAALFRLAMIYSVTSTPDAVLHRLIDEASSHADN